MPPTTLGKLLLAVAAIASSVSCGTEVCEPAETPKLFEAIKGDLPKEAVFCDWHQERIDFPAEKETAWPDGKIMPNVAHLNFNVESPHDAWMLLVKEFEAKGWKRVAQNTDGLMSVTFTKDGTELKFDVNENPAESVLKKRRVHAHVQLSKMPCGEVGTKYSTCDGKKKVFCVNGYPAHAEDCAEKRQSCAEHVRAAACVTDFCLATNAGTGNWNDDKCPDLLHDK